MREKLFSETRIAFSSREKALLALAAIAPELSNSHEKRAVSSATAEKNQLVFSTAAEDFLALRATMNNTAKTIALIIELCGG